MVKSSLKKNSFKQDVPLGIKEQIHQARSYIESFQISEALDLLRNLNQENPNNEVVLFELGYLLYEQGDLADAEKILRQSLAIAPEKNSKKYFTLGEIVSDSNESKYFFQKGLAIEEKKLQTLSSTENVESDKIQMSKRLISQGLCVFSEIEIREQNFKLAESMLHKAVQVSSTYLESYSILLHLYFNLEQDDKFNELILKMMSQIELMKVNEDEDLTEYDTVFFNPIVRMMIECGKFKEGAFLMEIGLDNSEYSLEASYLLAFCYFNDKKINKASEVIREMEEMNIYKSGDQELIDGFNELKSEIAKQGGELDDEEWESDIE